MDIAYELLLFAACGLLVGGIDELIVDLIFLARNAWRRTFVYSRHDPATVATLPQKDQICRLAIFVPAWDEATVIAQMLQTCLARWRDNEYRIFVGCYANDPATQNAVGRLDDPRISQIIVPHDGPTTKADCLNHLWAAMLQEEKQTKQRYDAIVLHDAEDVVHPQELTLYRGLIDRFGSIQIPVVPLPDAESRWVSGHYLDEFAEAHGKAMVVRETVGAALPLAGVGCAIRRELLSLLAVGKSGKPFDETSLTEDYELGLTIGMTAYQCAFVRIDGGDGSGLVAVKAHFPSTIETAVRQKTRWIMGIALAGWDRTGWTGGLLERWMRLRDRRTVLAALVITAGYLGALLALCQQIAGIPFKLADPALQTLLWLNAYLLLWRAAMRCMFVTRDYGIREGLMSIPRMFVANLIQVLAARRALVTYVRKYGRTQLLWAKTSHKFPKTGP